MNLTQLQAYLARELGLTALADDPVFQAWSLNAFNEVQNDVATRLQIPRATTVQPGVAGPFPVPAGMQSWGLLSAWDTTNGNPLAIVGVARRQALVGSLPPGTPAFLEYDPALANITPYPAPAVPVNIELYYAVVPTPLANPTDQPLNGLFQEWHHVIALGAAQRIIEADWADENQVRWLLRRYEDELVKFAIRVRQGKDVKPRSEVEINDAPRTA